jgi:hypothetical protein
VCNHFATTISKMSERTEKNICFKTFRNMYTLVGKRERRINYENVQHTEKRSFSLSIACIFSPSVSLSLARSLSIVFASSPNTMCCLCLFVYSFTSQRDKSLLNDRVLYRICSLCVYNFSPRVLLLLFARQ